MIDEVSSVNRAKLGKGGEFIVAGKLLLNGFKVYLETIDDGVDLIASKSDNFYYFQVKTCQDVDYDSGKFIANLNIDTFKKSPSKNTFLVLVLHYLGPNLSIDNFGNHNIYDQMVIPIPGIDVINFLEKKSGRCTLSINLSLLMDGHYDHIVWMKSNKKTLILDDYLYNSFSQMESK